MGNGMRRGEGEWTAGVVRGSGVRRGEGSGEK